MRAVIVGALAVLLLSAGLTAAQSNQPAPAAPAAPAAPPAEAVVWVEDRCPPPGRTWASAEFLLWWLQDADLPYLVTTGSDEDDVPAAVGQESTRLLFGSNINLEPRGGSRFAAGLWLDESRVLGVDGSFFFLAQRSIDFFRGSTGDPIVALPFTDVADGAEHSTQYVARKDHEAGSVAAALSSRLWGFELNGRTEVCRRGCHSLDVLAGFRFAALDEALGLDTTVYPLTKSDLYEVVDSIQSSSSFGTRNRFYGGQLGCEGTYWCDYWRDVFFRFRTRIAFGTSQETVTINGATALTNGNVAQPLAGAGGPFALPTNSGRYQRNEFAVMPEVGLQTGLQLLPCLRATVGYTFLYWSNVVRPGDQIDTVINRALVPPPLGPGTAGGPQRPAAHVRTTDFWAQGLDVGLEFRY